MNKNILDRFFAQQEGARPGWTLPRSPAQIDAFRRRLAAWRGRLGLLHLTEEQRQALLRPPPQRLRELALFYAGFFRRYPDVAGKLGVPEGLLERLLQREIDSAQLIQIGGELLGAVTGVQLRLAGALKDDNGRVEAAAARLADDDTLPPTERARIRARFKTAERDRALLSDKKDREVRKVAQQKQALLHRTGRARGEKLLDRVLRAATDPAEGRGGTPKKGLPR